MTDLSEKLNKGILKYEDLEKILKDKSMIEIILSIQKTENKIKEAYKFNQNVWPPLEDEKPLPNET